MEKPGPAATLDSFESGDQTEIVSSADDDEHTILPDGHEEDDHTQLVTEDSDGDDATMHLDGGSSASGGAGAGVPVPPVSVENAGPLDLGQSFGSRYRIDTLLGFGGMGAVYKAWDNELDIPVALKVIRPEVAQDPVMAKQLDRRFKRELLLARKVTHKNVVRIHDLGEIDGIKYITMTFIEGEDLLHILKREGTVSVP